MTIQKEILIAVSAAMSASFRDLNMQQQESNAASMSIGLLPFLCWTASLIDAFVGSFVEQGIGVCLRSLTAVVACD